MLIIQKFSKMNRLLIFLCCLFFGILKAQTISKSTSFQLNKRGKSMKLIGSTEDQTFVGFMGQKEFQVAAYDANLNMDWIRSFSLQSKESYVQDVHCFADTAIMFYTLQAEGKRSYYWRFLNFESLNKESGKLLFDISLDKNTYASSFGLEKAYDQNEILVYVFYENVNENAAIKYAILDSNLNIKTQSVIELQKPFADTRLKQSFILNDGTPLFVIYFRDKEKKEADLEKYNYILYTPMEELKLRLKANKFINNLLIKSNNGLYLAAYYDSILRDDVKGVYIAEYECKSGKLSLKDEKYNAIDEATKERVIFQDPEKLGASTLDIIKVISRDDGGLIVFGEERYSTIVNYSSPNMYNVYATTSINYLHFNNVLVSSFDSTGLIEWSNVVSKKQMFESRAEYASCFVYINSDYLELFYNDDFQRNNSLVKVRLLKNGKLDYSIVSRSALMISELEQVDRKSFMGFLYDKEEYELIKYTQD